MTQSEGQSLLKLLFCAVGTFFSYSAYGLFQEKITRTRHGPKGERFVFTTTLVLLQCVVNAIIAILAAKIFGGPNALKHSVNIRLRSFAFCALTYIGAMFSSNHSLQHVNYPTQVLAKSAKPISVMLVGFTLGGFRYPLKKVVFVLMISVGVVSFVYKEPTKHKAASFTSRVGFNYIGETLLLLSLMLDGVTSLFQERMRSAGRVGPYLMMLQMNMWSLLYLSLSLLYTQEFIPFYAFAMKYPEVLGQILLFGLSSGVGQLFIFTTVTSFGPLMCSIVTTTRKFFSILLSVAIYQHPMLPRQWAGTVLVFVGLFLDMKYGHDKPKQA